MPIIGIPAGGSAVAQVYPKRAGLLAVEFTKLTGNAFLIGFDATQHLSTLVYQNAAANGDEFTWSWLLAAGNYTLYLDGKLGVNGGKQDLYFRLSSSVGYTSFATALDWYANPAVLNTIKTATLTIPADGLYVFKSTVNGKNAASGGYFVQLSNVWIKQATD